MMVTLATGLGLSLKAARPQIGVQWMPTEVIQPLHTLGAMGMLLGGIASLTTLAAARCGGSCGPLRRIAGPAVTILLLAGGISIIRGEGSGLEYLSWPTELTLLPLLLMACVWWTVWRNMDVWCDRSSEGAWLLLLGTTLAPLGMVERLLGADSNNATRALMIEWHALDTVFAGMNTALYGLALTLTASPGHGHAMRRRGLFALAVIALLSTFGHHHYASAQPEMLKWIAFGASMLAAASFVRHVRMVRNSARNGAPPLELAAGAWTVFAVASGVLLALPQVNHLLHGTHAVVAHSMGAIVGVNVLIILGGLIRADARSIGTLDDPARRACRLVNIALPLIVADLLAAGLCKGLLRVESAHWEYQDVVRAILLPLPVLGLALSGALVRLGMLACRASLPVADARGVHGSRADTDQVSARRQRERSAGLRRRPSSERCHTSSVG